MTGEGVTTLSQKDVNSLQQEVSKLQQGFSQLEVRLEGRMKEWKDELKRELKLELQTLFEQYFGCLSASSSVGQSPDKGKGVLGEPSPLKDPLPSFSGIDMGTFAQWGNHKLECPKFDGTGFRGWWAKLEQYFEAVRVPPTARVRTVMLHLEGKALGWHLFYTQQEGGFHMLVWETYAQSLRERFGSSYFQDPMTDLVALKQQGSVEQYFDTFVSLLNQVQLPESYALSIFSSNLKSEIGQYLPLFKPKSLAEGFLLARRIENILNHSPTREFLSPWPVLQEPTT